MSPEKSSEDHIVAVSDWNACYNSPENLLVISCAVSTTDATANITGIGLMVNDAEGRALAPFYNSASSGSEAVYPAVNLPPHKLKVGDGAWAVVQGECQGQHFFFETRTHDCHLLGLSRTEIG